MKKSRIVASAGALLSLVLPALVGSVPASAAPNPLTPTVTTIVTPMTLRGFDVSVAHSNGFEIVTDADGIQSSVPVTSSAREMVAAANSKATGGLTISAKATGYGACGSSWISVEAQGITYKKIGTGFSVKLPVTQRWWGTTLLGGSGAYNVSYNGGASGSTWSSGAIIPFPGSGIGYINQGSFVVKSDGAICFTAGPQVSF